jgi:hypothetical protein
MHKLLFGQFSDVSYVDRCFVNRNSNCATYSFCLLLCCYRLLGLPAYSVMIGGIFEPFDVILFLRKIVSSTTERIYFSQIRMKFQSGKCHGREEASGREVHSMHIQFRGN